MAFCMNCGAQVEGNFCGTCGRPMPGAPAAEAPGAAQAPPTGGAPSGAQPQAGGLEVNLASALCYLLGLITGVLFLVIEPHNKNKTVRFHAFQSIFFSVAWIALSIALSMVSLMAYGMSLMLGGLISMLHLALGLAGFVLWLILMWKAYNNSRFVIPVIGPMAERQA